MTHVDSTRCPTCGSRLPAQAPIDMHDGQTSLFDIEETPDETHA